MPDPLDLSQFEGHTPGDWRSGRPDMATIVEGYESKYVYAGEVGRSAKTVAIAWGGNVRGWDEVMANANLIAAAPQLLEELKEARARIAELEGQISQAIDGLSKMIGDGICLQDGGGFFVPMYDPDGEYLGEQQLDPQHVAIMGFSMASDLLNMLKGGQDACHEIKEQRVKHQQRMAELRIELDDIKRRMRGK